MLQVYEQAAPLYKIKYYGNSLYRVIKSLTGGFPCYGSVRTSPSISVDDPAPDQEQDRPEGKFQSALSRARNMCREYCLCNHWEYFVTLTFDSRWDRYDLNARIKELMQHIQNLNKQGYSIRYVLVPEFHKDGAVHLHGLMSGIPVRPRPDWWPDSVNLKKDGTYYQHCPLFSSRYGFSSVEAVKDPLASGFYVSKYINKSMAEKADLKGVHTYYHSRGLSTSVEVGAVYHETPELDAACKFENSFFKFGFCRIADFSDAMCLCDEVSEMYQSWVITDPETAEVVSIVGGDTEDNYIQEVIEGFKHQGMRCVTFDFLE